MEKELHFELWDQHLADKGETTFLNAHVPYSLNVFNIGGTWFRKLEFKSCDYVLYVNVCMCSLWLPVCTGGNGLPTSNQRLHFAVGCIT